MKQNTLQSFLICAFFLPLFSCTQKNMKEPGNQAAGKMDLHIQGNYYCYWWSVDKMNFDISNIPAKNLYRVIEKWEYSDPVGVPHPDSIDLKMKIIDLSKSDSVSINYDATMYYINAPKNDTLIFNFPKNENQLKRENFDNFIISDIPIGHLIDSITKINFVPAKLSIQVSVKNIDNSIELVKKSFDLPIIIGD